MIGWPHECLQRNESHRHVCCEHRVWPHRCLHCDFVFQNVARYRITLLWRKSSVDHLVLSDAKYLEVLFGGSEAHTSAKGNRGRCQEGLPHDKTNSVSLILRRCWERISKMILSLLKDKCFTEQEKVVNEIWNTFSAQKQDAAACFVVCWIVQPTLLQDSSAVELFFTALETTGQKKLQENCNVFHVSAFLRALSSCTSMTYAKNFWRHCQNSSALSSPLNFSSYSATIIA